MKRSKFSLSHTKLFSCDMGEFIPIGLVEVLPGDTFQHQTNMLLRASPLLAPVMHKVDVRIHHFFVPHRLTWRQWEDFITGGPDGMNADVFPTMQFNSGVAIGELGDYLGIPTGVNNIIASALPIRAYNLIWNEYFRDQDLEAELPVSGNFGPDTATSRVLQNCDWEKDYFTSSRPWEQKGPSITLPLGTQAPVRGIGKVDQAYVTGPHAVYETDRTGTVNYARAQIVQGGATNTNFRVEEDPSNAGFPNIYADLTGASAITVTALREALALQRFEEARARWGSRYVEYLRYLGVRSSDARLQRPEYLGGGRDTIQWSEVLQTAEGTDPVGDMKGHGIAAMRSNRYRRFFEEHGYVMSLMSVRPKTMYIQGLPRTWNRRFKEDFFQKELQHIGQQEVLNKEVYAAHASPNGIFGYQDRYDEYRRQESWVSGEFRSSLLNFWHLARDFTTDPALNASFVKCVPTERVFAVPSQDVLYCYARHSIQARRLVDQSGKSFIF